MRRKIIGMFLYFVTGHVIMLVFPSLYVNCKRHVLLWRKVSKASHQGLLQQGTLLQLTFDLAVKRLCSFFSNFFQFVFVFLLSMFFSDFLSVSLSA